MTHSTEALLRHILLCLDRIAEYTEGGRAHFFVDTKTQDSVIRNLEIIGQAVRDAGIDALAKQDASIPWRQIGDLRNVLAHQYLGVDPRLVWNVVENELPKLRDAVARMLGAP